MKKEIEEFIQFMREQKKHSENTCVSYNRDLQKLLTFCQEQQLQNVSKITPLFIQSYLFGLEKNNLSTASVARHMSTLKAFFSYEVTKGHIESNPMNHLKKPKVERKLPIVLNEFQVETLLKMPDLNTAKGCRDKAMLELLYATGLRVNELLELKLEDLNMELSYITCTALGRQRVIPFGKYARQALHIYIEQVRGKMAKENDNTLFVSLQGKKMSRQGFWKILKNYAKMSGIEEEITPTTLRHSFALHLVENGADLHAVQEMLGHVDMNSTQVYAELSKRKIREVYNQTHPRV